MAGWTTLLEKVFFRQAVLLVYMKNTPPEFL